MVLDASKALEAANATGDAQKIKAAMAALEAALRGQAQARRRGGRHAGPALVAAGRRGRAAAQRPRAAAGRGKRRAGDAAAEGRRRSRHRRPAPAPAPKPAPKPVIAMRGDDRPGMKKAEPMPPGRGGKFGDRKGGAGASSANGATTAGAARDGRSAVAVSATGRRSRIAARGWATSRSARSAKRWSTRS